MWGNRPPQGWGDNPPGAYYPTGLQVYILTLFIIVLHLFSTFLKTKWPTYMRYLSSFMKHIGLHTLQDLMKPVSKAKRAKGRRGGKQEEEEGDEKEGKERRKWKEKKHWRLMRKRRRSPPAWADLAFH